MLFAAVLLAGLSLLAQDGGENNPKPVPPALPSPKTPVDSFGELLAMQPAQRAETLARKSEPQRKVIQARLAEFDALPPDEQELRLLAMKLRYQLLPLLRVPAPNRAPLLIAVSTEDRPLLEERLAHWDRLPADLQQEVLENEAMLNSIVSGKTRWPQPPDERQQRMYEQFRRLFDLTPREADKTLRSLSKTERQQMDKTLAAFKVLPKFQRDRCVASFQKFAGLSLEERAQFLRDAAEGEKMKPSERQAWRELVSRVPPLPPLPPGFNRRAAPPLPPLPTSRATTTARATNR